MFSKLKSKCLLVIWVVDLVCINLWTIIVVYIQFYELSHQVFKSVLDLIILPIGMS